MSLQRLGDELVFDWLEDDWLVVLSPHKVTETRLGRLSFTVCNLALGLRLLLQLLIDLDPVKEFLTTARVLHVLHAQIDALGKNALLDALVDDDAERVLCDVVHDAGAPVVALVRHALLHRAIAPNIYDVALLVRFHVGRQRDDSVSFELAGEEVTRPAPIPFRVYHLCDSAVATSPMWMLN